MSYASKTAAILASAAFLIGDPAMGEPPVITQSQKVRIGDLDLSQRADVQTLFERIDAAARRICLSLHGRRAVQNSNNVRACRAAALIRAAKEMDHESLTAVIEDDLQPGRAQATHRMGALAAAGR